jgi:hypothetical protein
MFDICLVVGVCGILFYLCGKALHECGLDYGGFVFVMSAIAGSVIFIAVSTMLGV